MLMMRRMGARIQATSTRSLRGSSRRLRLCMGSFQRGTRLNLMGSLGCVESEIILDNFTDISVGCHLGGYLVDGLY